ncbi:hypothetical protein D3C87_1830190 [compost metagenome]
MSDKHANIMTRLPFSDGLTTERLEPPVRQAGFIEIAFPSHRPIAAAQRKNADLRNRLRTLFYRRFVLVATRPADDAS